MALDEPSGPPGASGADHPDNERLAAYADRHGSAAEHASIERHLAECSDCRGVVADVRAWITDDAEGGAVANIRVPVWRRPLVAGGLLAAAASLVIGVALTLRSGTPSSASTDALIAQGYLERRTVEFRLPVTGYAPMRIERGSAATGARSASLLEAEARVTRELQASVEMPRLLQQQARIELLNWNYAAALPRLERVLELAPDDEDALLDLALGYFERAVAEERSIDYGTSLDLLSRLLVKNPGNRTALFNKVIVEERLMLYREAVADAETYLRTAPGDGWASEIDALLKRVRAQVERRQGMTRPCSAMTASTIVAWERPDRVFDESQAFEGGLECVRQRTLVDFLPGLVQPGPGSDDANAFRLAADTFANHAGDRWLRELVPRSIGVRDAAALRALSGAVAANLAVDAGSAEQHAVVALREFKAARNAAGEAQALVEYLYAIRRSKQGAACLKLSEPLGAQLQQRSWHWTSFQAQLELASCLAMTGNRGRAADVVEQVIAATTGRPYTSLRIRALSYLQALESSLGDHARAWERGMLGLREYWAAAHAPVWGYQLYFNASTIAETKDQAYLTLHLKRATLAEVQNAGRPSIAAFSLFDYGRAALAARNVAEARDALSQAAIAFSQLPRDRALVTALVECDIDLAQIELEDGHPAAALRRIQALEDEMVLVDSYPIQYAYWQVRTRAEQKSGLTGQAQASLTQLSLLARRGFESSRSFREQVQWSQRTSDTYREVAAALAVEDPARALDAWEWYRGATHRWGRNVDVPHVPAAVTPAVSRAAQQTQQRRIPQLLVYVVLEDRTLVWHVRQGAIAQREVAVPRATLASLGRRLRALCSSPDSDQNEIRAVSGRLSEYLLRSVEDDLAPDEPLWVELDQVFDGVPFGLLPLTSGRLVGDAHAIALIPGIDYLHVRSVMNGAPARVVAVGLSSSAAHQALRLPPLPEAVDEAHGVARRYRDSTVLMNAAATTPAISRELERASMFHFAGHSWNDAGRTGLLVAPESAEDDTPALLDAEAIAGLDLRGMRIAFISACAAEGVTASDRSTGFGVVLALLRAGAAGVIAARWDLDSQAAVSFARAFYDRLDRGDGPLAAWQAAALAIRSSPRTRHPYYWAAYQFFGTD